MEKIVTELPPGVSYIGPPHGLNAAYVAAWLLLEERMRERDKKSGVREPEISSFEGNTITAGLFQVNLAEISLEDLKEIRCVLPHPDYYKIKNRKSARCHYEQEKHIKQTLNDQNRRLKMEIGVLRRRLGLEPIDYQQDEVGVKDVPPYCPTCGLDQTGRATALQESATLACA